jgi:hypothetical protein
MLRWTLVLVVVLAGCATEPELYGEDGCTENEQPFGTATLYEGDVFNRVTLTCEHVITQYVCHQCRCSDLHTVESSTPIQCTSPCTPLDEAACIADDRCFVARSRAAVEAGEPGFLGCYPITSSVGSGDCTMRDVSTCLSAGPCAALYDETAMGVQFASCVDEL